jgi:two-component system sensor histidine kinase KdpD
VTACLGRAAHAVEAQADLLNRLVGNLLDMSRLQAGAMVLHRELNSLEEIAGDVAAVAFQQQGAERIALDFPDDLPLVPFDYGLMRQALSNIVDNALRYEPDARRVLIRGRLDADHARLEVVNHGPTIPPKRAHHRAVLPSRDGRSVFSVGAVSWHREIRRDVGQTPRRRATFVITLPQEAARIILVVTTSADPRQHRSGRLRPRSDAAANATEALALAAQRRPDAVDVNLGQGPTG